MPTQFSNLFKLAACLLLLTPPAYRASFGILLTYIDAARTRIAENMSRVRYPASPLEPWLDIQKTPYCCVRAFRAWPRDGRRSTVACTLVAWCLPSRCLAMIMYCNHAFKRGVYCAVA
jgi:hypothetical protein